VKIEVLNGGDSAVVRVVNPSTEEEVASAVVEPGNKVTIALPNAHEPTDVQLGNAEEIAGDPGGSPDGEAPAEGGDEGGAQPA